MSLSSRINQAVLMSPLETAPSLVPWREMTPLAAAHHSVLGEKEVRCMSPAFWELPDTTFNLNERKIQKFEPHQAADPFLVIFVCASDVFQGFKSKWGAHHPNADYWWVGPPTSMTSSMHQRIYPGTKSGVGLQLFTLCRELGHSMRSPNCHSSTYGRISDSIPKSGVTQFYHAELLSSSHCSSSFHHGY